MATTAEKITALRTIALSGEGKLRCASVLQVIWSDAVTRYYANAEYGQMAGFAGIPFGPIEPRLIGEPFQEFEINPDLRTDVIQLVMDDIDRDVSDKFKRYGTVKCILHYYWPDADLSQAVWHGQLQKPPIFGYTKVQTTATNGFTARERLMPHSMRPPDHCRFTFGGNLANGDAIRTNGCPYNQHLGGTTGLLNGSVPFVGCPRNEEACTARFGHLRFYGGYSTDATATVSDGNTGYVAISRGNNSSNVQPIKVIAGTKHVRGANMLLYRREPNQNDPEKGWFAGVSEVGEGPNRNIRNIKVNDKLLEQIHLSVRNGHRGQGIVTSFNPGGTLSNFSGVGVFSWRYGWTNPINNSPSTMNVEFDCDGYSEVAVYNTTEPGNGLLGQYYADETWTSETAQRIDHNINFPSTVLPPFQDIPAQGFSIRWTGTITFPFTETFTIQGTHDDGMKLWIDNTVIIDQLFAIGTHTGTFTAVAGVAYTFRCDFYQSVVPGAHPWYIDVKWSSPSTPLALIPNSAFNHSGSTGFVRQWSNDRVFWVMEAYTNHRWGLQYDSSAINTAEFREESTFNLANINFALEHPDGEIENFSHRRTSFDAILEGRSSVEQITDICRSGGLSVPFQKDGLLTIRSFRAATDAELSAAPIFTDKPNLKKRVTRRPIVWADGQPSINFQPIPDDVLTNEVVLVFEDSSNFDIARPITVDDPNQKLKAGKKLGTGNLETIPKRFSGFGVRSFAEALKLAYRFLWFGEFDEGGTKNNLRGTFYTDYAFVLDIVRYQIIKLDSQLLEGHGYADPFGADTTPPSIPEGFGAEATSGTEIELDLGESDDIDSPLVTEFEYFRVLNMQKVGNGLVAVTVQAYNHEAYLAFETDDAPVGVIVPPDPIYPIGGIDPNGNPCRLEFGSVHFDADTQNLVVPVPIC